LECSSCLGQVSLQCAHCKHTQCIALSCMLGCVQAAGGLPQHASRVPTSPTGPSAAEGMQGQRSAITRQRVGLHEPGCMRCFTCLRGDQRGEPLASQHCCCRRRTAHTPTCSAPRGPSAVRRCAAAAARSADSGARRAQAAGPVHVTFQLSVALRDLGHSDRVEESLHLQPARSTERHPSTKLPAALADIMTCRLGKRELQPQRMGAPALKYRSPACNCGRTWKKEFSSSKASSASGSLA
jgi:hypothetical protein